MLLKPGTTCWSAHPSPRAAFILDVADYYAAAMAAMQKAKRSVHLLNWAFEPETPCIPGMDGSCDSGRRFGPFLRDLANNRPELDVRLLCWQSALPVAATQHFFPIEARECFADSAVKFVLDGVLPFGASHHQKAIIIDDAVAFCGGADIGPDRWDTSLHADDDRRRTKPKGGFYDSRHEVMSVFDGEAAASLGQLFRERWRRASSETVDTGPTLPPTAWPDEIKPDFHDIEIGLARTAPKWRGQSEIRESEALTLAAIASAKDCIYLENQYFTSPVVAEALAQRLAAPTGPEVIIVSTRRSPSYFDSLTMDRTRYLFLRQLADADRHGRLHAYYPVTALGRTIIVHAKLSIIDDVMLRVGSSNMNNRSAGFDTECDVAMVAEGDEGVANRAAILATRTRLVAHWLGCEPANITAATDQAGGLGAAIERLRRDHPRLVPLEVHSLGPIATFVARFHVGDPVSPADSWRLWRRRAALKTALGSAIGRLAKAGLPHPRGADGFDPS